MPAGRTAPAQGGFTILEATVSLSVLVVAVLSLVSTLVYCSRSNLTAEQRQRALNAAQAKVEELAAQPFDTLVSVYGPGGTTGDTFPVPSLDPDPSNAWGRIVFIADETRALSDGKTYSSLDLNGDGDATDTDVSGDYRLLPVLVTIRWKGPLGLQRLDLRTLLRKEE